MPEQNQVRHLSTEHSDEASAPCRRCGILTSQRLVLRTDEHAIRANLWLCPACHQPQHRAGDGPAVRQPGGARATSSAEPAPQGD